ncbi:hypothetical protein EXIGLDRAFT_831697 [Exidia glandulosa HHB12029]|uniref:NACHT domain-containing protein n=1 Tax=Exidia glandulosa HHB12029 TaxID=1314781 RepID=A0A165ME05_EXIGL|nr:hypothetical protein EXIGLDRAFT_831697 [Exidia glandulosa HHB12029]
MSGSLALTAAIASNTAEIAGQPIARTLLGVAYVIADCARKAKVNQHAVVALSRRVDECICLVCSELETRSDDASDEWVCGLRMFECALLNAEAQLRALLRRSFWSQLITQERDAERIKGLAEGVRQAYDALMVRFQIELHDLAGTVGRWLGETRVFDVLSQSSNINMRAIRYVDSTVTYVKPVSTLPPPPPPLYMGRVLECQAVVYALAQSGSASPARVAILGSAGVGKTPLALEAVHAPAVVSRFQDRRYFVSFRSHAPSDNTCTLDIIAAAFGFASSNRRALERRLATMLDSDALLVLDGFDDHARRADAEQVLEFLSGFAHLSLIVTLRGTKRPYGVNWTRPFLAPLQPLELQVLPSVPSSLGHCAEPRAIPCS